MEAEDVADALPASQKTAKQRPRKRDRQAARLNESQSRPSKKAKRFAAFVAKQDKKAARGDLIKEIAASQAEVGKGREALKSSKGLGSGRDWVLKDKLHPAKEQDKVIDRGTKPELAPIPEQHPEVPQKNGAPRTKFKQPAAKRKKAAVSSDDDDGTSSESDGSADEQAPVEPVQLQNQVLSPPRPAGRVVVGAGLGAGVTVVKRAPKKDKAKPAWLQRKRGEKRPNAANSDDDNDDGTSSSSGEELQESSSDDSEAEADEGMDVEDAQEGAVDEEEWGGIELSDAPPGGEADESSSSSEEDEDDDEEDDGRSKVRSSAFASWARNEQLALSGDLREAPPVETDDGPGGYQPLLPDGSGVAAIPLPAGLSGPLGAVLTPSDLPQLPPQRTTRVSFERTTEIEAARNELPVVKEEDAIMRTVMGNRVTVLCGETGSGKTTQIGQFLLERGFGDPSGDNPGRVAITQPRRVAALSTAARVRTELALPSSSSTVSHLVRFSSAPMSPTTKLVYMTDGILLRELSRDFLLSAWSVVVVDEAHERGVGTDVLVGVLSRVSRLREERWRAGVEGVKPLRIIIMSATLRVADFAANTALFPSPPPVIEIPVRLHPVTTHFSRVTSHKYLEESTKKVGRIHARLPPGGVLVFLTGREEIRTVCEKLEKKWGKNRKKSKSSSKVKAGAEDGEDEVRQPGDELEAEEIDLGNLNDPAARLTAVDDGEVEEGEEDLEALDWEDDGEEVSDQPMYILPLYSLLSNDRQMKVFEDPPEGHRLVVVATNVAETSITIPGIRYVVDAGRSKERKYDPDTGIQSFEVSWISKASASQRAGRAGRTGPGHCYRLYSSAVFENFFDEFAQPEILRMPIEGIVLQMKGMGIDQVVNFPFPTPPDRLALQKAETTLANLGALERGAAEGSTKITDLGAAMGLFPVSPRFAKMLVSGVTQAAASGCAPYIIAIVAGLSVGEVFIREAEVAEEEAAETTQVGSEVAHIRSEDLRAKEERKAMRKNYYSSLAVHSSLGGGSSDLFKLLSVIGAYEFESGDKEAFCAKNFVRLKALQEIQKLRLQLSGIVRSVYPDADLKTGEKLRPPTDNQIKVLRQLITSAFIDQVAIRVDVADKKHTISYAQVESTRGVPYRAFGISEDLFIHPGSVLFHSTPPDFVVFLEVQRTSRPYLRNLTKINPAWLPVLGKAMCTFSKPIETAETALALRRTATPKAGGGNSDTRETFVVPRFGPGVGIELAPIKATQKRVGGKWVFL